MAITDESILKQLRKLKVCFLKYYPVRVKKNIGIEQQVARHMVWDFKDGKNFEQVAVRVAAEPKSQFGDKVTEIVFCCVPASSAEKNEIRYKEFSRIVCELSGRTSAYKVNVWRYMNITQRRASPRCKWWILMSLSLPTSLV